MAIQGLGNISATTTQSKLALKTDMCITHHPMENITFIMMEKKIGTLYLGMEQYFGHGGTGNALMRLQSGNIIQMDGHP